MKIKCYGPEVLNEENKKYLFDEADFDGKYELLISRILKILGVTILLNFLLLIPVAYVTNLKIYQIDNGEIIISLMKNLIILQLLLIVLLVIIKSIMEVVRKVQDKNEGVIIDLIKEIVLIEDKNEKREFFERDRNTFLGWLKVGYRKNLDSGKEKLMFVKLFNDEYKEGEMLEYHEFDNGIYVLLHIRYKYETSKLKRKYGVEDYFAIITKSDFNKIKENEKSYMVNLE